MDVDNLAYAVGLPEDVRARVEVAGRVQLTPEETLSLTSSKFAHTCLVPLGIIVAVGLVGADAGGGDNSKVKVLMGPPIAAFLLAYAWEKLATRVAPKRGKA